MPKKKTGARKKAEKLKERQKNIRASAESRSIVQYPCNILMVCKLALTVVKFLFVVFLNVYRNVISVKGMCYVR